MSGRRPPALANWLLDWLGCAGRNPALAGDLLEEFQNGRSAAWYWRQTFMAIATGIGRNAYVSRWYLAACIAGFAAQAPVVYAMWRIDQPHAASNWLRGILASLLLLLSLAVVLLWFVRWQSKAPTPSHLRQLLCAGAGEPQNARKIMLMVAADKFTNYFAAYCVCSLCFPRLSLSDFAGVESVWLCLMLAPALVRVPGVREPAAAEPMLPQIYPPHELGLSVALSGGETILLRPETAVASVFASGDEELVALFRNSASLEHLRRAIWLGSARKITAIWRDPAETPSMTVDELISLIGETAGAKSVVGFFEVGRHDGFWKRTLRRFRH